MKRLCLSVIAALFALSATGLALAGNVPTPTKPPEGVTIITAPDAKSLIDKNDVKIFDMRKALNYGKGHIPEAVSLPYKWTKKGDPSRRTGEFNMSKLPPDKNARILFYSDGLNGWKSYYASKTSVEAGYKNVMWMREGFAVWQEKDYTVEH